VKKPYISDVKGLEPDQAVSGVFQLREKEVRNSPRTGKSWLHVVLADRTGTISGKMWDNFKESAAQISAADIVRVQGRVRVYQDVKELAIERIGRVAEREYSLDDFVASTKRDVEQMYARLVEMAKGMENPWLRKLTLAVIEDPEIGPKLKRAPAAMMMHHAYIGGLLEHIMSLCELAKLVASHYPEVNLDLVLTGAVLHDIGKTEELTSTPALDYTDEGRLVGHLLISMRITRDKIDGIPNFPKELAMLVEHLVASHHGSMENGSPREPSTREALLFSQIDDMDAKMSAMNTSLEQASEGEWTERNPALKRRLYRAEEILRGGAAAEKR
jgi:3'-5' exoribonuclease